MDIQNSSESAVGYIPVGGGKPITVIGTKKIRDELEEHCLQQAVNSRNAPGVTDVVVNPDAHLGYGAPVGCVMASPTHIYPGPVGVDIKCSMSMLQFDLPETEILDPKVRRELIKAIEIRVPTGPGKGQRSVRKAREMDILTGFKAAVYGADPEEAEYILEPLGIPTHWADRCEDAFHRGHKDVFELAERLEVMARDENFRFESKIEQLGSLGGGNHFAECEVVRVNPDYKDVADTFGLKDGHVGFLTHCGSRGFGFNLAQGQFKALQEKFELWGTDYPAGDKQLVYAPLGTPEADAYLDDMSMGANFATVNHLLINALVLEAFQEVIPGVKGELVYFISHNIARQEVIDNKKTWIHRKGATRAYPGGHFSLKGTPFARTGHPILLPGNPVDGSVVMVARDGAKKSLYSVNHGAGRTMGRKAASRRLDQAEVDAQFRNADILSNCSTYPIDEAPAAYKDFNEVVKSVEEAGLASRVAKLEAKFVIKDADKSLGGAA